MIGRFIVDDAGSLIDMQTGTSYDYFEEIIDLLNQMEIDRVEQKRQLGTLKYKLKKLSE